MYFIEITSFQTKTVYHNKMQLHCASLKNIALFFSTKPQYFLIFHQLNVKCCLDVP